MKLLEGLKGLTSIAPGAILSIGNFDGLHLGHRRILETMTALRQQVPGARAVVATFEPHPLTVLRPQLAPPRLTPIEMKRELLGASGLDDLVELAPSPDVLNLPAAEFWKILRDQVRPAHLVEGSTFNFGKGRGGHIEDLKQWAADSEVKLHVVEGVSVTLPDLSIVAVSSSLIRWLLAYGRVRDAAIALGRNYALRGEVVKGHERGKAIGVPTANLRADDQLIPADGVYAGQAHLSGRVYPAAVSIGTTPTFNEDQRQVEAHLIGFSGDLYGSTLEVKLSDWLREQFRFSDVQQLKGQIERDILECVKHSDAL